MPFTVSHAAIVLVFKKLHPSWFSLSGLIAGAMSPDLLYFLMVSTNYRGLSHSWTGLLLFCLPAGVLFAWSFNALVKYHLIVHLPSPIDKHLSGLATTSWGLFTVRDWVRLIISVLIGTVSHFFWDSFTHLHGEMVTLLPFLKSSVTIFEKRFYPYNILQHASTLIGGIWLLWYISRTSNVPSPDSSIRTRSGSQKLLFWIGAIAAGSLFAVAVLVFYQRYYGYLVLHPVVTLGLGSWAGFYYAIAGYGVMKKIFGFYRKSMVQQNIE